MSDFNPAELGGPSLEHFSHAFRYLEPDQRLEAFLATPESVQAAAWERVAGDIARDTEHLRDPLGDVGRPPRARRGGRRPAPLRRGRPHQDRGRRFEDDPLLEVDAATYIEVIAGVAVPRSGMVRCPLPGHKDRTASCSVTGPLWHCFGCGRGGGIYDFGAQFWGCGTRGSEFVELRRRLAEELLGVVA